MPGRTRTLPTRSVVVIVNLGPPLHLVVPDPGTRDRDYGSFVAGMHDAHGMYTHPGGQRGIQLDLTPLGAYTLLGVPMAELTNAAADLADVLGPGTSRLVGLHADRTDRRPARAAARQHVRRPRPTARALRRPGAEPARVPGRAYSGGQESARPCGAHRR